MFSLLEKKFEAVNWELKGKAGSSGLGGVGSPKVFVHSLRGVWDILDGIKSGYSVKRVCTASRLARGEQIIDLAHTSRHVMKHRLPNPERHSPCARLATRHPRWLAGRLLGS